LDVGSRQNNRAQADSIICASAFDQRAITDFVQNHWSHQPPPNDDFGNGQSAAQFVVVLQTPDYWLQEQQKSFVENLT
jgi:UDP-N-acetylglucosamine 2-epimerase (hydrolysing)